MGATCFKSIEIEQHETETNTYGVGDECRQNDIHMRRVFIIVPPTLRERIPTVIRYFASYGPIEDMQFNEEEGFDYSILFANIEDAQALTLNQRHYIDGQLVNVRLKPHILNLNFDCMEQILNLLQVDELCSFAETCTQLQIVAETVFSRKFARNMMCQQVCSRSQRQRRLKHFGHLYQCMYLRHIDLAELRKRKRTLQQLKSLRMSATEYEESLHFLRFCPNIEKLHIWVCDVTTLEACAYLHCLSKNLTVFVWQGDDTPATKEFIDTLSDFKHLKSLGVPFYVDDTILLLKSLVQKGVQLEDLFFNCPLNVDLINSIANCKRIKTVSFTFDCIQWNYYLLVELAKGLPELAEISMLMPVRCVTTDLIQKILPYAENLASFRLMLHGDKIEFTTNDYESLVKIVKCRARNTNLKIDIFTECLIMNVNPEVYERNKKWVEIEEKNFDGRVWEEHWF